MATMVGLSLKKFLEEAMKLPSKTAYLDEELNIWKQIKCFPEHIAQGVMSGREFLEIKGDEWLAQNAKWQGTSNNLFTVDVSDPNFQATHALVQTFTDPTRQTYERHHLITGKGLGPFQVVILSKRWFYSIPDLRNHVAIICDNMFQANEPIQCSPLPGCFLIDDTVNHTAMVQQGGPVIFDEKHARKKGYTTLLSKQVDPVNYYEVEIGLSALCYRNVYNQDGSIDTQFWFTDLKTVVNRYGIAVMDFLPTFEEADRLTMAPSLTFPLETMTAEVLQAKPWFEEFVANMRDRLDVILNPGRKVQLQWVQDAGKKSLLCSDFLELSEPEYGLITVTVAGRKVTKMPEGVIEYLCKDRVARYDKLTDLLMSASKYVASVFQGKITGTTVFGMDRKLYMKYMRAQLAKFTAGTTITDNTLLVPDTLESMHLAAQGTWTFGCNPGNKVADVYLGTDFMGLIPAECFERLDTRSLVPVGKQLQMFVNQHVQRVG